MSSFLSLGVSKDLVNKLYQYGVVTPTPIQEKAIPSVIEGKDIIAQAQTGTGKTFAFILPILEKINPHESFIQALIVTPTRELAIQITNEIEKLTRDINSINVLAVYGGQDVDKQLKKLKKNVQIVVGTPGRLLDHIGRETVNLSKISFLVLDEADQMLHIGFLNEVENIIKETPNGRQTMLFSATIPPEIRNLAKKHMCEPKYIQVEKTQGPAETVNQVAIHTIDRAKQATLIQLINTHRPYLAVVFCRTKRRVSKLYEVLKANGFPCAELHGDLSQAKREQVMKRFREAEIQLLIATDVAARGLDIEGVTHVFNYDIPQDSESYIHRIGRTGRAGMAGIAITLYSSADRPTLDLIEKELSITIKKQNIGNMEKGKKLISSETKSNGKDNELSQRKSKGRQITNSKKMKDKNTSKEESKRKVKHKNAKITLENKPKGKTGKSEDNNVNRKSIKPKRNRNNNLGKKKSY